ncbi:hypothetical protein QCA50_008303 [Cerrena zonata]|uniref:Uncharacterized protein n=1 Tax=Cerrena zonata TaxID=2478898 RepID=A0AAW0GFT4_9APHY
MLCCAFFDALFTTLTEFLVDTEPRDALNALNELMEDELGRKGWVAGVQRTYQWIRARNQDLVDAQNHLNRSVQALINLAHIPNTNELKITIVLDEAYYLTKDANPSHGYSRPDLLCRTISAYSKYIPESIWVIFVSTNPCILDFAVSAVVHKSTQMLITPYRSDINLLQFRLNESPLEVQTCALPS